MCTLYHVSYGEITKIIDDDHDFRFGTFLFFGTDPAHYGDTTYSIDIDDADIIDCGRFFYREDFYKLNDIVAEVMSLVDCNEDYAQELLSGREILADPDLGWHLQYLTAKCAKALGYRGVSVPDEYGTSYMIDMLDRESELVKC